jgi:hypothetical protein
MKNTDSLSPIKVSKAADSLSTFRPRKQPVFLKFFNGWR